MATTAKGTPYVVSTDLVANYPTVSSDLATHIDAKLAYNAVTINAQTGSGANAYTFALADASEGKLVTASNAAAATYTVPPQSSVTWPSGSILRIVNIGAGIVTIGAGSGVTVNNTAATLAQYDSANIIRTASDVWQITKGGGLPKATYSATTGSPTVTTVSGKTCVKWTGDGSVTMTAGIVRVLLAGGGGGSGNDAGGGAGGYIEQDYYVPADGTYTIKIGAGGTAVAANIAITSIANNGGNTIFGRLVAGGGGAGNYTSGGGAQGASTGGSARDTTSTAVIFGTQGNIGGAGQASPAYGGGGGGSATAGSNGSATNVSGGEGTQSSIDGTPTYRSAGGNVNKGTPTTAQGQTPSNTAGAANSGSGGGNLSKAGGSGIAILLFG